MLNRLLQRARWEADPPFDRRVFVNRNLRMETIEVVCFDLDWTLAAYQRELLQRLIFETAIERLIEGHEYDETLRTAEFRPDFAHRGLLIDKACGTVIKMDRHRYVGRGFLGRRRLSSTERLALYRSERIDLTKERFYHVDTLFDLAEVNLFSELVELVSTGAVHHPVSYEKIAADVRTAVDGIHHDGTLKSEVIEAPRDPVAAGRRNPDGGPQAGSVWQKDSAGVEFGVGVHTTRSVSICSEPALTGHGGHSST